VTVLLGTLAMVAGTLFLIIAAIGVFRLPDAFQRMHGATKAGTLGATLVVLGAAGVTGSGLLSTGLTVLFLLLTLPVGAQLLGRAAYMSGATIHGMRGQDPLRGVLPRRNAPLEERVRPASTDQE
jgi:multicomponent Na+:H+ antiporter subunit G